MKRHEKKKRVKRISKENKKGKVVTHSERYWRDQELEEWEKGQIKLAYHYTKLHKRKLKRLSQELRFSIPSRKSPDEEQDPFKGLDVDHLKDQYGNVKYWGDVLDAPKPKRYPNGLRSAEDLILNPGKIRNENQLPLVRRRVNARIMVELMRRLKIDVPRVRLREEYIPHTISKGDWQLTDAVHGCRKFDSKEEAIKSADQPYSYLTDLRNGEDEEGRYNFKRYRIKIKKVDGKNKKLIKLLSVERDFVPEKVKPKYRERCTGCNKIISPLEPALVTQWESIDGVQRAKSAWCSNCEHRGHKIAKKKLRKKRKLKKLLNKKVKRK